MYSACVVSKDPWRKAPFSCQIPVELKRRLDAYLSWEKGRVTLNDFVARALIAHLGRIESEQGEPYPPKPDDPLNEVVRENEQIPGA